MLELQFQEAIIGKGAVIGSNAFITSSIEPEARVSIKNQELNIKTGTTKNLVATEMEERDGNSVVATEMETDDSWFYVI